MSALGAFWNPEIETLTPAGLRRLESERLARQIDYNYRSSAFFRAKLDAAPVRPEQIRSVEDLARVPFMEKREIAQSQEGGALLGVNQCAPLEEIVRIQATGGTTGLPMRIGWTRRDIRDYGEMGARALWAMGCRPRSRFPRAPQEQLSRRDREPLRALAADRDAGPSRRQGRGIRGRGAAP